MPLVPGALAHQQAAVSLDDGGEDANGQKAPNLRARSGRGKVGFQRWLKIGAGCDRGPVSNCHGAAPPADQVGLDPL